MNRLLLFRSSPLLAAAAAAMFALSSQVAPAAATDVLDHVVGFQPPPKWDCAALTKWVQPLSFPPAAEPDCALDPTAPVHFTLTAQVIHQKLHPALPPTKLYGYSTGSQSGSYPGPTFDVRSGQTVLVRLENDLPLRHILPIDLSLDPFLNDTQSRAVTHLHGGRTESDSDGLPTQWFTNGYAQTGAGFKKKTFLYDNAQPATQLIYHDHALVVTRLNVYAGLIGLYTIRDVQEDALRLPTGRFEIPLLLQDKSFNADGSLFYPFGPPGSPLPPPFPFPSVVPEFFGNVAVINGRVWPFLRVEPRLYRFRITDGANARFFNVGLFEWIKGCVHLDKAGPRFLQIGSDQGFMPRAVPIPGRILLGPAERVDVLVDFRHFAGKELLLHNNAPTPFQGSFTPTAGDVPLPELLLIKVAHQCKDHDKPHKDKCDSHAMGTCSVEVEAAEEVEGADESEVQSEVKSEKQEASEDITTSSEEEGGEEDADVTESDADDDADADADADDSAEDVEGDEAEESRLKVASAADIADAGSEDSSSISSDSRRSIVSDSESKKKSKSKHGRKKKHDPKKKPRKPHHRKDRKHKDHKDRCDKDDDDDCQHDLKCKVTPPNLSALPRFEPLCPSTTRSLSLSEGEDEFGRNLLLIDNLPFEGPVTILVPLGASETWSFINTTPDVHPMHIHLVRFHVVSRRPFNVALYNAALAALATDPTNDRARTTVDASSLAFPYTGPAVPETPDEIGWKDVVKATPGFVTSVVASFDRAGPYVVHCHILEHEDHDMMRPYIIYTE